MAMTDTTQLVYQRPESLADVPTHYCPGCTHGVAHRLVAEVMDEMDLREQTIGVAPVGCSVFAYNYFDCDFVVSVLEVFSDIESERRGPQHGDFPPVNPHFGDIRYNTQIQLYALIAH